MSKNVRINNQIRVAEVRLIDADGSQVGVVPVKQALETAKSRDLDLVEVAPNAKPPVCKIMDFGKYKYQLSKKQTQKKTQDMKEIKLRPRIDTADLERKVNNMRKFLDEGHKTKVTMFFRGRERGRPDLGMQVFDRLKEMLEGKYNIVNEPRFVGNSITMVVAPK
ncbi:MAG: translation initiation factor IF-3 [Nitrospirota bacterium]